MDVVSICSMNHEHGRRSPPRRRKHLLIEKPMALTLEELRRVQRAIERAGVKSQGASSSTGATSSPSRT